MGTPTEGLEVTAQLFDDAIEQLFGKDCDEFPFGPFLSPENPSHPGDMLDFVNPDIPNNLDTTSNSETPISNGADHCIASEDNGILPTETVNKHGLIHSCDGPNSDEDQDPDLRTDIQQHTQSTDEFGITVSGQSSFKQFENFGATTPELVPGIAVEAGDGSAAPVFDETPKVADPIPGSSSSLKQTTELRARPTADTNVLGRRHFAEFGQTSSEAHVSDFTSPSPPISAVIQRYNAMDPNIQKLLCREFMYLINRYSHALAVETGQKGTVDALVRTQVQSDTLVQSQPRVEPPAHTLAQQQIEIQPQAPPTSHVQNQSQNQDQDQIHTPVDSFRILETETPTISKISVTPSTPEAAHGHGEPSGGPNLPESSPPIVSAPRSRRIMRYRRNGKLNMRPSMHCHICSRRPTVNSPHVPCGNVEEGTCRKAICRKCFSAIEWEGKVDMETAQTQGNSWKCTHCTGVCPLFAQCFVYGRTSDRRRKRNQAEREAAIRFNYEEAVNAQAVAKHVGSLQPHPGHDSAQHSDHPSDAENDGASLAYTQNDPLQPASMHLTDQHIQPGCDNAMAYNSFPSNYSDGLTESSNVVVPSSSMHYTLPLNAVDGVTEPGTGNTEMNASAALPLSRAGSSFSTGPSSKRRKID